MLAEARERPFPGQWKYRAGDVQRGGVLAGKTSSPIPSSPAPDSRICVVVRSNPSPTLEALERVAVDDERKPARRSQIT